MVCSEFGYPPPLPYNAESNGRPLNFVVNVFRVWDLLAQGVLRCVLDEYALSGFHV